MIENCFSGMGHHSFSNGFCDASHGNCLDSRRSFSEYLFQVGDCTISWRCRKQRATATSTCEAEYMALTLATKHFIWLCRGLAEISSRQIPSAIFNDSNSARDFAQNPKLNDASKHIDIAYHFTREKEDESLTCSHISSPENMADICTKGLPRPQHDHLCTKIFAQK